MPSLLLDAFWMGSGSWPEPDFAGVYGDTTYGSETYGSGVLWDDRHFPLIYVEIAFTSNPGDDSQLFEDITWTMVNGRRGNRVRGLTIHRGKQHELDRMQAGTASLILDNRDRYLDPVYVSSPWYPNVIPDRRLRIWVNFGGAEYNLYQGLIDGFPQSYRNPNDGYVEVPVTDAFKFFTNAKMPVSVYDFEVLADEPVVRYRLAEQEPANGTPLNATAQAAESMGTGYFATYSALPPVVLGRTGPIVGHPDSAAEFPGAGDETASWTQASLTVPIQAARTGSNDFSIEMWFFGDPGFTFRQGNVAPNTFPYAWSIDFTGVTGYNGDGTATITRQSFWTVTDANGVDYFTVEWDHDQTFAASVDGDGFITTPFTDEFGAKWHHLVCTKTATGGEMFCDGVSVGTASGTVTNVESGGASLYASVSPGIQDPADDPRTLTAGQIAYYDTALSAERVLAHYQAGTEPWADQLAGERISHVLDVAGWPQGDRELDDGNTTFQSSSLASTVLEQIQVSTDSEYGEVWIKPNGNVKFRDRHAILTEDRYVNSQATFGDAGPNSDELPYRDITIGFDDTLIVNEVSVARDGGTAQVAKDATSQQKFMLRSYERSGLSMESDNDAKDQAAWVLAHYKDPRLRVQTLAVEPQRNPAALFPIVFSLDIGDRITVVRRPQGVGDPITQELHIEGISHTADAATRHWRTEYQLSSADIFGVFTLDVSELDGSDVLAY